MVFLGLQGFHGQGMFFHGLKLADALGMKCRVHQFRGLDTRGSDPLNKGIMDCASLSRLRVAVTLACDVLPTLEVVTKRRSMPMSTSPV